MWNVRPHRLPVSVSGLAGVNGVPPAHPVLFQDAQSRTQGLQSTHPSSVLVWLTGFSVVSQCKVQQAVSPCLSSDKSAFWCKGSLSMLPCCLQGHSCELRTLVSGRTGGRGHKWERDFGYLSGPPAVQAAWALRGKGPYQYCHCPHCDGSLSASGSQMWLHVRVIREPF